FAGGKRPFLTISPINPLAQHPEVPPARSSSLSLGALADRGIEDNVAAALAWVDGLGALGRDGSAVDMTGLDAQNLPELGVKHGSLSIDDARNGRQWSFKDITLSLTRPDKGGVAFNASSESYERSWSLSAALVPQRDGRRSLRFEANQVLLDHLLLVMQLG